VAVFRCAASAAGTAGRVRGAGRTREIRGVVILYFLGAPLFGYTNLKIAVVKSVSYLPGIPTNKLSTETSMSAAPSHLIQPGQVNVGMTDDVRPSDFNPNPKTFLIVAARK